MTAPLPEQPNPDLPNPDLPNPELPNPDLPNPELPRVFVALGSNLGDRWANLGAGLAQLPGVVAVSRVYETEPAGGPPGQGPTSTWSPNCRPRPLLSNF